MSDPLNGDSFSDEVYAFVATEEAQRLFGRVFHRYRRTPYVSREDLMQDMAVRCLEQAHHFHGGNVAAWARTVANRCVLNEIRRPRYKTAEYSYQARETDPRRFDCPAALTEAKDTARALWESCTELDRQTVSGLVRLHGDTPALVQESGINKHTLHGQRKRVRAKLNALTEG